ncbi:MAG: HEPN domain-containing protein [Acidobacteriota bacterium]
MTDDLRALVGHRLTRAYETLAEARGLCQMNAPGGALNRLYYAALYAARALLATEQVDSSKHSGVIALFQRHFVKSGIISPDRFRVFPRAFEKRLKSDYGDFATSTMDEVNVVSTEIEAFLRDCERILRERQALCDDWHPPKRQDPTLIHRPSALEP